MPNIIIHSSHGDVVVNDETGVPIGRVPKELPKIRAFNLFEYREHYPSEAGDVSDIDILDVGYWYEDSGVEKYEAPEPDFRAEVAREQSETAAAVKLRGLADEEVASWRRTFSVRRVSPSSANAKSVCLALIDASASFTLMPLPDDHWEFGVKLEHNTHLGVAVMTPRPACPSCGDPGPSGAGCPKCPGFWFAAEAVEVNHG